jgi:hypothetical protein
VLSEVQEQELGVAYLRKVVEHALTSPLLLVGEEGVGRRFAALQATKELVCSGTRQPGCKCLDCSQIDMGNHPDITFVGPVEDKDIGIDAIRSLIQQSGTYPSIAPLRVFILDGADRLTGPAANAILKVLEEPPSTTRFFLLAESAKEIIPTIRSRCGIVPFRRLSEPLIVSVLQRYESDPAKALVYARIGEGSVGRAVQYWTSGRLSLRDKVFSLLEYGLKRDLVSLFSAVDSIGPALPLGLRFFGQLLLDVRMIRIDPARVLNSDMHAELQRVGPALNEATWHRLVADLRRVRVQQRTTYISLPFHVKTLLATIFVGS